MADDGESREALHSRLLAARSAETTAETTVPPPPYHVRDVQMIFLTCRFKPEAVRAIVPPELTPSQSGWGVIAMYSVPHGWGIAPYSGFFMSLELDGVPSNDGSPGMYMHSGFYSGVGGQVMQTVYNRNFRIGWSRNELRGGRVVGEAGIGDRTYVRISADVADEGKQLAGTSRYIGRRSGGGFNSYFVSFALTAHDAKPQGIEFLDGAGDVLHLIEPQEYVWPIFVPTATFTFSPPRPIGDAPEHLAADARNLGLVALFSRMGRAAAIVGRDGQLVSLNAGAEGLVRDGAISLDKGRLQPGRRADAAMFGRLLVHPATEGPEVVSDRVALTTAEGRHVIAQAIALDPQAAGPDKLLVFFDDPTREVEVDPAPALQLLGLTPAEARVAGLVGAGRSPREAADELELTLNTVRSALKIAFDKLGISRQSELAKIVARLAG